MSSTTSLRSECALSNGALTFISRSSHSTWRMRERSSPPITAMFFLARFVESLSIERSVIQNGACFYYLVLSESKIYIPEEIRAAILVALFILRAVMRWPLCCSSSIIFWIFHLLLSTDPSSQGTFLSSSSSYYYCSGVFFLLLALLVLVPPPPPSPLPPPPPSPLPPPSSSSSSSSSSTTEPGPQGTLT